MIKELRQQQKDELIEHMEEGGLEEGSDDYENAKKEKQSEQKMAVWYVFLTP